MSCSCMILLLAALIGCVDSFQSKSCTSRIQVATGLHLDRKETFSTFLPSSSISDVESKVEVSDIRRMIDESAVRLMKRFWEIDLQTQRRMDMILRLYEVILLIWTFKVTSIINRRIFLHHTI